MRVFPRGLPWLACAAALAMAALGPLPAAGAPVYTVLAGEKEAGVAGFLEDLSRMWRLLHKPTVDRLAVVTVEDQKTRLRKLSRGRGHFAVIHTSVAASTLAEHEDLAAIALLWPDYLHALTASRGMSVLGLPLSRKLAIAENARYAYEGLMEWSDGKRGQRKLLGLVAGMGQWFEEDRAEEEVLLFSAPAPLAAMARRLADDDDLRLLRISGRLVEELRLRHPWMQTATLPRNAYPGMKSKLVLPVRHQLLVGRKDLPAPTVEKMLRTLYRRKGASAPINPLFGALDKKLNRIFAELFPYHAVAAKALGFPLQSP